jgi:hypothetical protein
MKTIRIVQTDTTFAFPVAELLATYNATSKEETRYYLQGVLVERQPDGVRLVATDGHVLLRTDAEGFAPAEPIILSIDTMEKAFKVKGKNPWVYGDTETGIVQVVDYDPSEENQVRLGVCEFTVIDGTFPDYTRVIPKGELGDACAVTFDPNLIGKLHKAGAVFDKSYTMRLTAETPDSPMLVEYSHAPQMIGVLMPRRFQ